MKKRGKLYLIPAPLAAETEHQVIPAQVLALLPGITHFIVENIRTSRRYISSLKLGITIDSLQFEVLDKRSDSSELKKMFRPILDGKDVGLLSEAGVPGVADPGALAVEYAHKSGIEVVPLVGPSSILLALMASGFNGQRFTFHGYLPIKGNERVNRLQKLEKESRRSGNAQIFIETPYRNNQLLESMLKSLAGNTLLCIACNLTSEEQWVKTRTVDQWKSDVPELHKLPVVFLLQA